MKKNIYIYQDTNIKKGGGANFMSFLANYLNHKHNIKTNYFLSEKYIINSFPFNSPFVFFLIVIKAKIFNNILIYRVDGPISIYRRMPEDLIIDRFVSIVSSISNHVIYQSKWSLVNMQKLNSNYHVKNYSIIKNSYFPKDRKVNVPSKKYKILISTWSNNWIKGFEIYQYVDLLMEKFKNIEVDFVGRSPIEFKNINHLGVMNNNQLMEVYSNYHIFLTASLFDPCSNSLVEAKSNKCLIIARDNGGHPELISKDDLIFKNQIELEDIFRNIDTYFKKFKKNIEHKNNLDKISFEKYEALIYKTKNLSFKNYIISLPNFLLKFLKLIYLYFSYKLQIRFLLNIYKRKFLLNFQNNYKFKFNHNSNFKMIINQIPIFLETMHSKNDKHFYRMTLSSDIKRINLLYPQIYVLKIYKILSINNLYQKEKLIFLILDRFLRFEKNKIYINDHNHIKRINFKSNLKNILMNKTKEYYDECSRADTRQTISALMESGYNCSELIKILYTKDIDDYLNELQKFSCLNNLDNAWHDISHLSHLLFETSLINNQIINQNQDFKIYLDKITNTFCSYITKVETRSNNNLNDSQSYIKNLVNGLMKLFSGFKRINYVPNLPFDRILNIILKYHSQANACDFLNTFFVIDYCLENENNDYPEFIFAYLDKLINRILSYYYYPDLGGFSFYKNSCQYAIYYSNVAYKSNEPDIHGTLMFTWLFAFYGKITKNKSLEFLNVLNT